MLDLQFMVSKNLMSCVIYMHKKVEQEVQLL